jgi:hypothetical protein
MSKTAMWKKCAEDGNLADAKTFPPRHAGANAKWGLIQCMTSGRGDR